MRVLRGDVAEHATARPGPGERLTVDDFLRQAELRADFTDFVLEELAERFDELEFHAVGRPPTIVVALDERGRVAGDRDALDHIRVERPWAREAVFAW